MSDRSTNLLLSTTALKNGTMAIIQIECRGLFSPYTCGLEIYHSID